MAKHKKKDELMSAKEMIKRVQQHRLKDKNEVNLVWMAGFMLLIILVIKLFNNIK